LKDDPHQCIIHGDIKYYLVLALYGLLCFPVSPPHLCGLLALPTPCLRPDNMCFDAAGVVTVCDFQYCGRASPMKDLAYLLTCGAHAGESFLRVYWVAVPEAVRARRVNRLLARFVRGGAGALPRTAGRGAERRVRCDQPALRRRARRSLAPAVGEFEPTAAGVHPCLAEA
jgi:hypothetical protein